MLMTCQAIFGVERGTEVCAFLAAATGQPCACCASGDRRRPCRLMPPDEAEVVDLERHETERAARSS
jgi:hypothetical protein